MSSEKNLKLIVLKSALELGKNVDFHLMNLHKNSNESFIVPVKETWFSDGHGKVELLDSVRDKDVYIITDIGNYSIEYKMNKYINHTSPNDLASQLKDTLGACKCHTRTLSVIMPLLYAGRQHRRISREALSCATYLHELDCDSKVNRIITFDAHDDGVQQALFQTEFDNFYATNIMLEQFINNTNIEELKNIIFVAPDSGAIGRMNVYLNSFNSEHIDKDAGNFYKRRDYNKIVDGKHPIIQHSYSGNPNIKGKTAIIVDDMISSGSSMLDSIDTLKKMGVEHVYIMCTYALFTEGIEKFKKYYEDKKFDGIYTTNLSYIDEEYKKEEWLNIVDCSKYIADIIYNLHNGDSICSLLRDKSYPSKVLEKKFKNS